MPSIALSPLELERINQAATYARQQQIGRLIGWGVVGVIAALAIFGKRGA